MSVQSRPDQPSAPPGAGAVTSEWRRVVRQFTRNRLGVFGLIVVVVFISSAGAAPILAPYDPYLTEPVMRLQSPSAEHWLGTDELGRDLLSRLLYGSRISLMFGVMTTAIALVFGILFGVVSGYFGGAADNLIMRVMDLLLAFPGVLLAIAVVSVLGPGTGNAMIAIGLHSVPIFARTMRVQVLTVREREYVQAARSLGASPSRIISRHVLPNTIAPLIVLATLRVATAILAASTLSFLGLGVQRPHPEWGAILSAGRDYIRGAPHVMVYPGLALSLVVIGFSSLGDALRDAIDPRLRR